MPCSSKTFSIGSEVPPLEERFNGCLGLLVFRMKRFGYPLDCSVDIIHCFSLLQLDFVVETFSAQSANDLTTFTLYM